MKLRFKMVLLCAGALVMAMPISAQAVKYTTMAKKEKTMAKPRKEAPIPSPKICPKDHAKKIKKFNKISKRYLKKYYEVSESAPKVISYSSKSDYKKYMKNMERASNFFKSDKYKEMKPIYEACDQEIPRPKMDRPFWMSGDEQEDAPLF